ncbi:conserved phage C-terminal domain-containing protein [Clostridium sp. D53t1_180928_C8]|uniref:conserved phage C-terminal domain-containing protein n=1 Tax=Clostridium sp. D53t1_180928_C8 TaxID=2787101 RepID=UPI001FAE1664|nr:conserved phage C-terminal domain-containing protein [Clostridium sp. D53t1_180928_C8]
MAEANYYAIIPANVRYDSELSDKAKLLYGEITALTNKEGYCWASNNYFAELYGVKVLCIKRNIKDLVDKGYLKSVLIYDGKLVKERRLFLNNNGLFSDLNGDDSGIKKDTRGGIKKDTRGGIKKDTDNITSINITSINIYSRIIDYLNKKADTRYRSNTKKNKDLIKARINEGFTEDDFIKVIDNKVKEWANTDMQKYLRPETLFGTKFEGYLNQKEGVGNGQYSNGKFGNRWGSGKDKKSFNVDTEPKEYELSEDDRRRAEELI